VKGQHVKNQNTDNKKVIYKLTCSKMTKIWNCKML